MKRNYVLTAMLSLAVLGLSAQERTITRTASQNATVYFANQTNANGKAERMVLSGLAGENSSVLLYFDLSDLPTDADVKSASLTLNFTNAPTIALMARFGLLTESWTEGPANPTDIYAGEQATTGDVTWTHSSYDTEWVEGDFESSVDPLSLFQAGTITSSSTLLSVDSDNNPEFDDWVKDWIANPNDNFGLAIVTQSNASAEMYGRSTGGTVRPTLEIVYEGDPPASVENRAGVAENVRVYPNPTQNNLNVTGLDENVTALEIMDISGRVLRVIPQSNLNTVNTEINVSNLSSGTYFLKINSENGQAVKTFIVR